MTQPPSLAQGDSAVNLHAPFATLIVGVSGNTDPDGYDARVVDPKEFAPEIQKIYLRVWHFLDWVFGKETQSPLGMPSLRLSELEGPSATMGLCTNAKDPRLKNKCEFLSGKLEEFKTCWKPLNIEHTPVVLLSSISPGIDTIVAEVFLDYRKLNPDRNVFVRVPLPFPIEILDRCSSYRKEEDKVRLRSLLQRLRTQDGWDEQRDLFCVKIDGDWEPIQTRPQETPVCSNTNPICQAQNAVGVTLGPEADLESTINIGEELKPRRYLRYRAAGEYIASLSHLLLAIYDHELDHQGQFEDGFRKPLSPFEPGTWAIVESKRRGLSWELLATSNNFSWADNGPVLRLGIKRKKRTASSSLDKNQISLIPSPEVWSFLHPYDLEPQHEHLSEGQKNALWQASGDFVFRRILDLQETFNKETKLKWNSMCHGSDGESELIDMLVPNSEGDGVTHRRDKLISILGSAWQELRSLAQAAKVRRCSGDLANKVYEPKRFRVLLSLIILVFLAASCLGMFEHWHRAAPTDHNHPISWSMENSSLLLVNYLAAAGSDSKEAWIRAGLLGGTILALTISGLWFILYNRARIEEKRYDYRALAEALRVQIYWSAAGLNRSVAHDYMQRQKDELNWIRYVASEVSFPLERWPVFFENLSNPQQNTLLGYIRKKWIGGQIGNATRKCEGLSHKLHLTHIMCWGLAWAGLLQLPLMLVNQVNIPFANWLDQNHWWLTKFALVTSSFGLAILFVFGLELAIHSIKWLEPFVPRWLKKTLHMVDHHFGEHEEPVAEPHFGRKLISKLVHYWQLAGVALFVGSLAFEMSYHLPELGDSFPDRANWWIINTGACLLSGALVLAWQERRFYSEEYRNYCSMRALYKSADRRLDLILNELASPDFLHKRDWTRQRLVAEAQDILYQVGCEALSENADWLILHRARPLEPFMAG
jgi:hypothetical protein